MAITEERRVLEQICDELRTTPTLTQAQWDRLKSSLGDRFDKAWQLVDQRRVKK